MENHVRTQHMNVSVMAFLQEQNTITVKPLADMPVDAKTVVIDAAATSVA